MASVSNVFADEFKVEKYDDYKPVKEKEITITKDIENMPSAPAMDNSETNKINSLDSENTLDGGISNLVSESEKNKTDGQIESESNEALLKQEDKMSDFASTFSSLPKERVVVGSNSRSVTNTGFDQPMIQSKKNTDRVILNVADKFPTDLKNWESYWEDGKAYKDGKLQPSAKYLNGKVDKDEITQAQRFANQSATQMAFRQFGGNNAFIIESNGHFGLIDAGFNTKYTRPKGSIAEGTQVLKKDSSGKWVYTKSSYKPKETLRSKYFQELRKQLKSLGVKELDFVYLTHLHVDHASSIWSDWGLEQWNADGIKIKKIYTRNLNDKKYISDTQTTPSDKRITYNNIKALEKVDQGGGYKLTVSEPPKKFQFGDFILEPLNMGNAVTMNEIKEQTFLGGHTGYVKLGSKKEDKANGLTEGLKGIREMIEESKTTKNPNPEFMKKVKTWENVKKEDGLFYDNWQLPINAKYLRFNSPEDYSPNVVKEHLQQYNDGLKHYKETNYKDTIKLPDVGENLESSGLLVRKNRSTMVIMGDIEYKDEPNVVKEVKAKVKENVDNLSPKNGGANDGNIDYLVAGHHGMGNGKTASNTLTLFDNLKPNYTFVTNEDFSKNTGTMDRMSKTQHAYIDKHGGEVLYGENGRTYIDFTDSNYETKIKQGAKEFTKNNTVNGGVKRPVEQVKELTDLVNKADKISPKKDDLIKAIDNAKKVLEETNSLPDVVKKAKDELTKAMENSKPEEKPEDKPKPPVDSGTGGGPVVKPEDKPKPPVDSGSGSGPVVKPEEKPEDRPVLPPVIPPVVNPDYGSGSGSSSEKPEDKPILPPVIPPVVNPDHGSGSGGSSEKPEDKPILPPVIPPVVNPDHGNSSEGGPVVKPEEKPEDKPKPPVNDGNDNSGSIDKPGQNNPDTNEPGQNKPDTNEPGQNKPDTNEPGQNKPDTNEPGQNNPDTNKPGQDKPDTNEPGQDKPDTNEPGQDKPDTNEPGQNDSNTNESDQNDSDGNKDTNESDKNDSDGNKDTNKPEQKPNQDKSDSKDKESNKTESKDSEKSDSKQSESNIIDDSLKDKLSNEAKDIIVQNKLGKNKQEIIAKVPKKQQAKVANLIKTAENNPNILNVLIATFITGLSIAGFALFKKFNKE